MAFNRGKHLVKLALEQLCNNNDNASISKQDCSSSEYSLKHTNRRSQKETNKENIVSLKQSESVLVDQIEQETPKGSSCQSLEPSILVVLDNVLGLNDITSDHECGEKPCIDLDLKIDTQCASSTQVINVNEPNDYVDEEKEEEEDDDDELKDPIYAPNVDDALYSDSLPSSQDVTPVKRRKTSKLSPKSFYKLQNIPLLDMMPVSTNTELKPTNKTSVPIEESIETNEIVFDTDDIGNNLEPEIPHAKVVAHLKKKTRNKRANPDGWQRNSLKMKIQSGQAYVTGSGNKKESKFVKPQDCTKCIRKCSFNFNEEDRNKIHTEYWKLADVNKQRQYLNSLIVEKEKEVIRTKSEVSRRQNTRVFHLVKNKESIQVCQKFFLATFDISDTVVKNVLKKRNVFNMVDIDKRGRHTPGLKRPDSSREYIIKHINSFPKVPSHYTRKDTKKEYLASDLNVSKMYEMYLEKCDSENVVPEKLWFYRNIFDSNFNLSFHTPRKDMCDQCYKFEHMTEDQKLLNQEKQDCHLENKTKARTFKDVFKIKAINGECQFLEFDFEAVRYCPAIKAKAIFYKRRLAVYNLTVYNVATRKALNYMWHEATAGRGSKEVASCLYDFLKKSTQDCKEFAFMSDTCGGQNRNVIVATMFLYAVQTLDITVIDQLFFEPGHSQMECDSVHAHIETASRNIEIYDPSGWYTVARLASKERKYEVQEVNQSEVYDFKKLQEEVIKNRKVDVNGKTVRWLDITWFQYRKSDPGSIYFKYDQNASAFESFKVSRRERRGFCISNLTLSQAYHEPLKIKKEKLSDLLELCSSGVIREQYHHFYRILQGSEEIDVSSNED